MKFRTFKIIKQRQNDIESFSNNIFDGIYDPKKINLPTFRENGTILERSIVGKPEFFIKTYIKQSGLDKTEEKPHNNHITYANQSNKAERSVTGSSRKSIFYNKNNSSSTNNLIVEP